MVGLIGSNQKRVLTYETCKKSVERFKTLKDLRINDGSVYAKINSEGWKELVNHLETHKNGWSKSQFLQSCGKGTATLYLIKCTSKNEKFYKIGITSRTVEERFRSKKVCLMFTF